MSSDDAGNRWVGAVPNGESEFKAGRQKPNGLLPWLIQQSGARHLYASPIRLRLLAASLLILAELGLGCAWTIR